MILIVCLDDNGGMLFNHRRQSRDRAVIDDITKDCSNSNLYMNEYSFKLFEDLKLDNIIVKPDFLQCAEAGAHCFAENIHVLPYEEFMDKVIIYKWNRKYPADFYFDIVLENQWKLTETKEFMGTSHDKITKEIYLK